MNDIRRKKLLRRKHRNEKRLARAKERESNQPVLQPAPIHYDVAERDVGTVAGGVGLMRLLIDRVGLAKDIDERVDVLKVHRPYHESDHVLAFAFNTMRGGKCIEDFELLRKDEGLLRAIGAKTLPDPTTAGDFCRRLGVAQIEKMMEAFNATRLRVWKTQPKEFFDKAVIDADGTLVETRGDCKEGMNYSYKGIWGYAPLVVSLAKTQEALYIQYRPGNRPSSEDAWLRLDQAAELMRKAGFKSICFRGDTDFSQTAFLDRWDSEGIEFVFGLDAHKKAKELAHELEGTIWRPLERPAKHEVKTTPRGERHRHKDDVIRERGFERVEQVEEQVAEFAYKPYACRRTYRVIVLRKVMRATKRQLDLNKDDRLLFYITNKMEESAAEIVLFANARGSQEKLIEQLKNGVSSLRTPLDTLNSNWAYSVMTSLAWSLKAWLALLLPISPFWPARHRLERKQILGMEFRTFLNRFMLIPALVVRAGRRIWLRLVAWNESLPCLLRAADALVIARLE